MAKTMRQWLTDGLYLPRRLRDFHDQKDVFKLIWHCVLAAQETSKGRNEPVPFQGEFNWVMGHCFVIDQFLWFMARHGYTLQRARPREGFQFEDLDDAVKTFKDEQAKQFREWLDDAAKKRKEAEDGKATPENGGGPG